MYKPKEYKVHSLPIYAYAKLFLGEKKKKINFRAMTILASSMMNFESRTNFTFCLNC